MPREVIEYCISCCRNGASGANFQPWHFEAVSDSAVKHQIRIAAENEEKEFYAYGAPKAWLEALSSLGTDSKKPFLEIAPWLIAIFAQPFRIVASHKHSASVSPPALSGFTFTVRSEASEGRSAVVSQLSSAQMGIE